MDKNEVVFTTEDGLVVTEEMHEEVVRQTREAQMQFEKDFRSLLEGIGFTEDELDQVNWSDTND